MQQDLVVVKKDLVELNVGPILSNALKLRRHGLARTAPARVEFNDDQAILRRRVFDELVVRIGILDERDLARHRRQTPHAM